MIRRYTCWLLLHVFWAILAYTFACGFADFWVGRATAQDHHHALHEQFYSHWRQPGSGASCCNARVVFPNGTEIGDCEPTEAKLIAGHWYARLPHKGPFIEVPEAKIIREVNPTHDGTDAHLCWTEASGVMCFVPPFGGG